MKHPGEGSVEKETRRCTSSVAYSIAAFNRTPQVKRGGRVEVDIFLSGSGVPDKNKLHIQWSSPYVINRKEPGILRYCIKVKGGAKPLAGNDYVDTVPLDPVGRTVCLNKGYFLEKPGIQSWPEFGIRPVMSESAWDNRPPISLTLNMDKKAPSGNYNIMLTFTYANDHEVLQDFKKLEFHVTSWWERHHGWILIVASCIAFLTLVATAVGTIWKVLH